MLFLGFVFLEKDPSLVTPAAAPSRHPWDGWFASRPTQLLAPGRLGRFGSWICHAGPACPSLVAVVASAGSLRLCGFMPSKHILCPPRWASGGVVDAPLSFVVMTSLMGALPCLFRRAGVPCRVSTVQQQWRRSGRYRLPYGARLCLHFMQPPRKVGPRPPVFR